MDPNEALRLIRAYIAQMKIEDRPVGNQNARLEFVQHARDLAETVEGLDQWLSRDGFLPTDWMAEEDKPAPDPDTVPCITAGEHQRATRHRWQECPVYHEVEPG